VFPPGALCSEPPGITSASFLYREVVALVDGVLTGRKNAAWRSYYYAAGCLLTGSMPEPDLGPSMDSAGSQRRDPFGQTAVGFGWRLGVRFGCLQDLNLAIPIVLPARSPPGSQPSREMVVPAKASWNRSPDMLRFALSVWERHTSLQKMRTKSYESSEEISQRSWFAGGRASSYAPSCCASALILGNPRAVFF